MCQMKISLRFHPLLGELIEEILKNIAFMSGVAMKKEKKMRKGQYTTTKLTEMDSSLWISIWSEY